MRKLYFFFSKLQQSVIKRLFHLYLIFVFLIFGSVALKWTNIIRYTNTNAAYYYSVAELIQLECLLLFLGTTNFVLVLFIHFYFNSFVNANTYFIFIQLEEKKFHIHKYLLLSLLFFLLQSSVSITSNIRIYKNSICSMCMVVTGQL